MRVAHGALFVLVMLLLGFGSASIKTSNIKPNSNSYANEVGEAFRAQVHVNVVRASYGVASAYVVADAISKGKEAALKPWPSEKMRSTKVRWAVADTLVWQGLASVAIPGFTINRVCAFSGFILARTSGLSLPVRKLAVTSIGLACIPLIIKPIDWSVDYLLEHTLRRWYKADEVLEAVVHHDREVHHHDMQHGLHHVIDLHHDKLTEKS